MRVVGCFLEFDNKFVILLRHSHKPDGDTWGLPSGKVEPGESDEEAILRELAEETGYKAKISELERLGDFDFVSSSNQAYVYVTFRIKLHDFHEVILEQTAHGRCKWVTAQECYARSDLIPGFHKLLNLVGYIE